MAVSLHLYFGLKAAFEFKSKVAVVNDDTLDQLSDQPFVVVRHRLLLALQKGFNLIQSLLRCCTVGVLHLKCLLFFPERINIIRQFFKPLFGIGFFQELFLQGFELGIDLGYQCAVVLIQRFLHSNSHFGKEIILLSKHLVENCHNRSRFRISSLQAY